MDDYQNLINKYQNKIASEFGEAADPVPSNATSVEYADFKKELYPQSFTRYEKFCNLAEKYLPIPVQGAQKKQLEKDLAMCHLSCTPGGVISFSILAPLIFIFVGIMLTSVLYILTNSMFYFGFVIIVGLILIPALQKVPSFMANSWRMKASNQMVQSIFYLVTFMRHTSNLERAIGFAAEHLGPPLSLDFRKIIWDAETEKYPTVRESAEAYLISWKEFNGDFVEAFHLIEGSLYEPSEDRRLALLDKSLDVILDGTFEHMLQYAHSLKSPMTILNMLGIILPILGLVILPLVVSFMSNDANTLVMASMISALYNFTLPATVFYLGRTILSKRPAGYGQEDLTKRYPSLANLQNVIIPLSKQVNFAVNPMYFSVTVLVFSMVIAASPFVLHGIDNTFEIENRDGSLQFLGYICEPGFPDCLPEEKVGPFGLGSSLLSLILVAGIGVSAGLYFRLRSSNVVELRKNTKKLEKEFSSALFQLGNRLGDGLPAEIAFSKVAANMEGSTSGDFFSIAEQNMVRLGMGLEQALFDPEIGAVRQFPSEVVESSMKVLTESSKRGPSIAAQALLSMSRYIKEIHRVEERLKDLMAEIVGSMKGQVAFLTPAIAGIVVGITSMISTVLTRLSGQLSTLTSGSGATGMGGMVDIFGIGIPTYYFQAIVGLYVVQLAYILTVLANGIENGVDILGEREALGKALINSTLLYCFIAGVVMTLFNVFASSIMKGMF